MRSTAVVVASLVLVPLVACVSPENAYDPDTDPARQARARLSGRVVLVDPNLDAASLASEASGLVLVLNDDGQKEVARAAGGDLDLDGGSARFTLADVVPGTYTLVIEGLHERFVGARPGRLDLLPGVDVELGDLRFAAPAIPEGQGTHVVDGEVLASAGAVGPRVVELFRLGDGGPESLRSATTDGDGRFRFDALSPGTYAVVASAEGYTPAYAMDLAVGEQAGASPELSLAGDDALVLSPVSAVLGFPDDVRLVEGQRYTSAGSVTLELLAFGGENAVTGMRLSTTEGFPGDGGEPLAFEPFTATKTLALPDVEGPIVVYAQFEARSSGGFAFVSPVLEAVVVRDVTPPEALSAAVSGATLAENGTLYLTADAVAPALELQASDAVSAVSGLAVVESDAAPSFDDDAFRQLFAPAGVAFLREPLALSSGDGEKRLWVALRDRAGNVSDAVELVIVVDSEPPVIDEVVIAGGATHLLSPQASVVVSTSSTDVAAVALARGGSEPTSFSPYDVGPLAFALEPGDGNRSVVARLVDFAGNESGDVSASVIVDSGAAVLAPSLSSSRDIPVSVVARAATEVRVALGSPTDDGLALLESVAYGATTPATLAASDDGEWRVFASVRDGSGVESGLLAADVVVDTTAPAFGPAGVEVDQGAAATRFVSVTVRVDVEDASEVEDMALATDGAVDDEGFQPFSPTVTALLPPVDCEADTDPLTPDECKSVCVVLRDAAGNVSAPSCDGIRLDTTPPSTPSITPLFATVRADTVEIRVVEPATDFAGAAVTKYEITSPAGDFFEVEGEGPFRFRLRPNRENELCVRGKDEAGNVGIEDCAAVEEQTLRPVLANGISSQGTDVFGDFLAYASRGSIWLHDLRLDPPESPDDDDLVELTRGIEEEGFWGNAGGLVRMAGDPRTLVVLHGPIETEDGSFFNVFLQPVDGRDLAVGAEGVGREAQLEGSLFDTDGRYIAYFATDGVYVHDLGPDALGVSTAAPIPRTATSERRVSDLGIELCPGTGPRVRSGVVVWCELDGTDGRVMRSRITDDGNPTGQADDTRELELISSETHSVAPTKTSIFEEAGFMQPVISERYIAWMEAPGGEHTLHFLEGIDTGLALAPRVSLTEPLAARNCAPLRIDRIADFSGSRLAFLTIGDAALGLTDVALFDLDLPNAKGLCITEDLSPQGLVSIDGSRLIYRDTANNESTVLAELSRTRWLSANPELAFEAVTSGRGGVAAWIETRPPVCAVEGDCLEGEACVNGSCAGDRRLVTLLARDLTLDDPEPEVVLDQSVAFYGPSEADPTYRAGGELVAWLRNTGFFAPPPFTLLLTDIADPESSVVVTSNAARALDLDPDGALLAYVEHSGTPQEPGLGVLTLATLDGTSVTGTVAVDASPAEVPYVSLERVDGAPLVVWQRGGDIDDRNSGGELMVSRDGSPPEEVTILDRVGGLVVAAADSGRVRGPKVALVGRQVWIAYLLVPSGPGSLEPHACRLLPLSPVVCVNDELLSLGGGGVRDVGISRDGLVAFASDEAGINEVVLFDVRDRRRVWATPIIYADGGRAEPDIAAGHLVWSDASLGTPDVFEMILRP